MSASDDAENEKVLFRRMSTSELRRYRRALALDLDVAKAKRMKGAITFCEKRIATVDAVLKEKEQAVES